MTPNETQQPITSPTVNNLPLTDEQFKALQLSRQHELRAVEEMVANVMTTRSQLFKQLFDPRRDIGNECGYVPPGKIDAHKYRVMYDRLPEAATVVRLMPQQCFQVTPTIYEDEDPENVTPFEEAWDSLGKNLRGIKSWHRDEEGSLIWDYFRRLDELSGIGRFGIMLLGINDGLAFDQPLEGVEVPLGKGNGRNNAEGRSTKDDEGDPVQQINPGDPFAQSSPGKQVTEDGKVLTNDVLSSSLYTSHQHNYQITPTPSPIFSQERTTDSLLSSTGLGTDAQYYDVFSGFDGAVKTEPLPGSKPSKEKRELTWLRVFDETLVQITRWESRATSPRFGLPLTYRVTLNDPRESTSGIGLQNATVDVHWSRVIHVPSDGLATPSEVYGTPQQQECFDDLWNIYKVRGAGAEGFWRSAFPGISLETHPQLGGEVAVDLPALKNMMEQYFNGMDRSLALMGMTAKTLSPTVSDPTPFIDAGIQAICVTKRCPVRIFKGSERGELASSQDDSQWNDVVRGRQKSHVTARIIVPFIDRLIMCGVLPEPKAANKTKNQPGMSSSANVPKPLPSPGGKNGIGGAGIGGGGSGKDGPPVPDGKTGSKSLPPTANRVREWVHNAFADAEKLGGKESPTKSPQDAPPHQSDTTPAPVSVPKPSSTFPQGEATDKAIVVQAEAGYSIEWPDLDSLSKKDKAAIMLQRTTAAAAYVSGGLDVLWPQKTFMTRVDSMTDEEADAIIIQAQMVQEQRMAEEASQAEEAAALAEEHGMIPTPPAGFQHPPESPPLTNPKSVKSVEEGSPVLKKPTGAKP